MSTRKTYRLTDETIELLNQYMQTRSLTAENEAINSVFKDLNRSMNQLKKFEQHIVKLDSQLLQANDRIKQLENQLKQYNDAINGLRLIFGTAALLEDVTEDVSHESSSES